MDKTNIPLFWKSTGTVYRCSLTGNMIICEGKKQRILIVSEAEELMNPTESCFQLRIQKTKNNK